MCLNALRGTPNAKVYPLHANLSSDEQRAVFAPTSGWKIIAATNVAEVSLAYSFRVQKDAHLGCRHLLPSTTSYT